MLAPARPAAFWIGLWALTLAVFATAVGPNVLAGDADAGDRVAFAVIGGAFAACGLVAWRRRPDSWSGPWMIAAGFGLFVGPVLSEFDSPRAEHVLVGAMLVQTAVQFARQLFLEREGNFLLVHANAGVADALGSLFGVITAGVCLGTAGVIGVRFSRASPPQRRALLPSVAGISALLLAALSQPSWMPDTVVWLVLVSLLLVPATFLASLLRSRLAQGDLSRVLGELHTLRGGELQARLARAVGDPSLVIAYGRREALVDHAGDRVEVGRGRSCTPLEDAALVYDSSLEQDPGLVQAVASATSLALEHQRQQDARRRVIEEADAERRRLERDLHGGAQQRLAAVAMQLRLVQADLHRDPAAAEARVTTASGELARSLEELRTLARGIHPAELDHGLAAALTSLAATAAVRTTVSCDALGALPRPVELALYLVAADALASVTGASAVAIRVERTVAHMAIDVAHDGTAEPPSPAVRDRVEALGGRLAVTDTGVAAELPCAS